MNRMNKHNLHTIILSGKIGIVDAALVRYLKRVKERKGWLLIHITESIFKNLIPKSHIEELVASFSIVDGILENKSEVKCMVNQKETILVNLPEEELQQYSLERILNKVDIEYTSDKSELNKLITLKELIKLYGNNPHQRKINVGLVSGSFDLIHLGHVRYIKAAKELVDVLIVATMSTSSIRQQEKNIMGDRPIYSQEDRVKVLSSIQKVDYIVVFDELDCKKIIQTIRPNYFVKHEKDMSRRIVKEECKLVESFGGKIIVTRDNIADNTGYSSTDIINYIRNVYSAEGWDAFFDI